MNPFYRDPEKIATYLAPWIKDKLAESCARGGVLGLSGGVDSAALAALLRKTCGRDGVLAVIMPCHSDPIDEAYARSVSDALDIPVEKLDLSGIYDEMAAGLERSLGSVPDIAKANIKPRLRMVALYAAAQSRNFLVFGGSNRDELAFGYFTKHGDSGVDLLPFGDLLKGEVFALAKHLGVPQAVIDRPPTAGLWKGQTDEGEMGVTYEALDRYLATGEGDAAAIVKIEAANGRTEHKRNMPPIAVVPR